MTAEDSVVLAAARENLSYDAETGVIVWIKRAPGRPLIGSNAGWKGKLYRYVMVAGVQYPLHRIAWLLTYGRWPNDRIDHVNGNSFDNRLCNLREATVTQNIANSKTRMDSTTGIKGVGLVNGKKGVRYRASIKCQGIRYHLGYFDDAEQAHAAYFEAAKLHFGEFASAG